MSWIARLERETHGGVLLPKPTKAPFVSFVSAPPAPVRRIEDQPSRLRSLAKLAGCPVGYVDRLHPAEVAEYAHYPDADVVASLRHLAACRACRERQCRTVTCATCARYVPDPLNPEAGVGQCGDHYAGAGDPPTLPHAPRHCEGWRAAA
jgi:hypothetical protein